MAKDERPVKPTDGNQAESPPRKRAPRQTAAERDKAFGRGGGEGTTSAHREPPASGESE